MIAQSSFDRERAVDLLVKHETCQFVGEREGPQRQHLAGRREHRRIEPEVGADEEGDGVRPLAPQPGELRGQLLGGERAALAVERQDPARLRQGGNRLGSLC